MKLHLLPLFLGLACGEPQSYPYSIKKTAEEPVLEIARGELQGGATSYESITYTTTINPLQTGKLTLNSKAKTLKQVMTVPSLRYKVDVQYTLDHQQQFERHFQQTGKIVGSKQLLDMLVVVSATDDSQGLRAKLVTLLTGIISALPTDGGKAGKQGVVDWRLAFVSADASDKNCAVIDTLADLQQLNLDSFASSNDERAIDKASAALGIGAAAVCSQFPRSNSRLLLLIASDKDHQCDADKPFDGSGDLNSRNKQTSYYCGSSLSRFHHKLNQTWYEENLKLYALLDNKSTCGQQRSDGTCYDKTRKQSTNSCQFTNPCYNREDSYKHASSNYRRAGIFDLIRYVDEPDYSKIVSDFKEGVSSLVGQDNGVKTTANKPFITILALGDGFVMSAPVSITVNGVELPSKHYRVDKRGYVLMLGDVRKYFPEGSVAIVKYAAKRSYKSVRLTRRDDVSSVLVYGADSYDFVAQEGLIVFDSPLPLKSELRVSYEYDVNSDKVSHKAHIGTASVSSVECCLSSNCSSQLACQLDDGMVNHLIDKQVSGDTSFTAVYSLADTVREFAVPHNCKQDSMFLRLNGASCLNSKLDIVDGSTISFTSTQAKDNCSMFRTYSDDDDVELHYRYSRQDDVVYLQQVPDTEVRIKVNGVAQTPVTDYLVDEEEIKFSQPLPTNAKVSISFTP